MKRTTAVLLALGAMIAATAAFGQQNADDRKWINQCISDNKGGASDDIIRKYCTCMNNKMDDNETRSITQWEKTHKKEQAACSKEAGWRWGGPDAARRRNSEFGRTPSIGAGVCPATPLICTDSRSTS